MYIQPRHLSKMLTSYERLKQKKMDQNLVQLKAAGVKNVPKFLLGLNQSANIKVNDMEEVDIGRAVDGDEDVVLFDGEERLCSNSDNDDPSGSKTNEVNGTGPRKKKPCSSAQPLRKSQRTQEQGGSTQGATQAQQLPTSPTEQTDMFCSPHTVVGCEETPASLSRTSQNLKRKRGPTKLKTIAVDGSSPIEVKFDDNGEPIGEGSVKLSSFLGPLVREIVPYTLKDWRKLPLGMAEILWQSIKVRFNLHEEWHRQMVFRRMNEDWRASKSILVKKIRNASNEEERLKLQPDNVKSLHDWKDFVKEKTSKEFKLLLLWFCYGLQCLGICVLVECSKNKTALCFPSMLLHYFGCPVMLLPRLCCCCYGFVGMICYCYGFVGLLLYCCLLCGCFAAVSTVKSENFKAMRDKQLEMQHTMSRKGYARLTAELKVKRDVASISRAVVWANGHRDKNGKPKNKNVAQKIEEMGKIERNGQNSTNLKEDAVSKVLGAERNGRVRTFGKGVTQTRLTILSQMKGQFAELREENAQMKSQMSDMRNSIDEFKKSQVQNPATTEATPTTPLISPSVTCHPQSDITKCKLLDWMGTGDVVAEGRWASSDPHSNAHCVPIGPNAMKVWVDVAKKPEEFLWRAPSDMTYIVDAVGSTIAWPADFVILDSSSPGFMG